MPPGAVGVSAQGQGWPEIAREATVEKYVDQYKVLHMLQYSSDSQWSHLSMRGT